MGTLAAPLTVEAQPAGKGTPKLGYLSNSGGHSVPDNAFLQGLRDLGYAEGQNLSIEARYTEGRSERFSGFAADLVRLRCQRPPHIEPPGSGKLSHPGSPIVSQAGSPILSHPGSAIGSHPVERDRIPSSFSPSPEILAGALQLQEVTSGGTEESGDRHP